MAALSPIVIAGYARSPFTLAKKGGLARVRPDDLAAQVIRELIARTEVDRRTSRTSSWAAPSPRASRA